MEKRPPLADRLGKAKSQGQSSEDKVPMDAEQSTRADATGAHKDSSLGMGSDMTYRPSLDKRLGQVTGVPGGPTRSGPGGSIGGGKANDEGI